MSQKSFAYYYYYYYYYYYCCEAIFLLVILNIALVDIILLSQNSHLPLQCLFI